MRTLAVVLHVRVLVALARRDQQGQAAAEYALVLLGVAVVATLVGKWAAGTDKVGTLLDAVLDRLLRTDGQ
jgi:Flp pilus assembly pilin Flp